VEPLGKIMKQLTGGGGAAKVNIDKVGLGLGAIGAHVRGRLLPNGSLLPNRQP